MNEEKLAQLLADYDKLPLDTEEIERLRGEVSRAKSLVYITDNAGEIVLDKLFIEAMKGLTSRSGSDSACQRISHIE